MKLHQCPSVPLGAPVLQPSQACAHGKGGSTEQPTHSLLSPFLLQKSCCSVFTEEICTRLRIKGSARQSQETSGKANA